MQVLASAVRALSRKWGLTLAAVFAVLGLADLAAISPARAEDVLKVSLNAPYDSSNAAFLLADDRGYYAAEDLKVTFDPSGGSGDAVTRIGSGAYDFGFGDINVMMEFNAKNPANAGAAGERPWISP